MKLKRPTGLGEPQPEGKLSLFQPPKGRMDHTPEASRSTNSFDDAMLIRQDRNVKKPTSPHRIRTTIDLTGDALVILQQVQQEHRLRTGRALPIWKALSLVIAAYAERQ